MMAIVPDVRKERMILEFNISQLQFHMQPVQLTDVSSCDLDVFFS